MNFLAASAGSSVWLSWAILGLVFLALALALFCVFTIHRNPYFNELQKIGWLILCLGLPIFGPISWLVRAHHEKRVQSDAQRYGVQPVAPVSDYAARLVPVYGDEPSDGKASSQLSTPGEASRSGQVPPRSLTGSVTEGKTTRFAPSSDFVSTTDTSDSAENPHLSQGKDGGPRTLEF